MKKFVVTAIVEEKLVRVESDGTEQGTVFTASPEHIERFREAIHFKQEIEFRGKSVSRFAQAGYGTPLAVAVALYSIAPLKVTLWEAPKEVFEFLTESGGSAESENIPEDATPICGKPLHP